MTPRTCASLASLTLGLAATSAFAQVQGKCVYNCGTPSAPARSTGSASGYPGFDPSSFGNRIFDAAFEAGARAAQRRREEQALQQQLLEQQRQAEEQARREEAARQREEEARRAAELQRNLRRVPDSGGSSINIGSLRLRNALDQLEQTSAYGERARNAPSPEAAAADARRVFDTPAEQRLAAPAQPQPPEVLPPSAALAEVDRRLEHNAVRAQSLRNEIEHLRANRTDANMATEAQKRDELFRLEQQDAFLRFRKNQLIEARQ